MKQRIGILICCICMAVILSACARQQSENEITQVPNTEVNKIIEYDEAFHPKDSNGTHIYTAVTDFAVRLLQADINHTVGSTDANRLLSPLSILTALSMTANGADGETREQMEETFGITIESLNQFLSYSMSGFRKDVSEEGNKLHMANSIWYTEDAGFTVKEDFLDINEQFYHADIYESAFNDETLEEINQWVENNTDSLIKEIINEIPADAVMYLINTLVFDAKWEESYEETDIREGTFTVSEGIEQAVDMMYSDEFLYLEDEHATGFVKYYEGRDYAFAALLPNEDITLQDYIDTISGEQLYNMLSEPQEVMVHTWIPQFEVEYQAELHEVLSQMGIKDLFDASKADLSALGTSSKGNLFVDRVIHKTYIEVSPVGTKAGAATVVEVKDESASIEPENVKEVCLDRPFLYLIIDCENNQPIFVGTINYIDAYRCGIDEVCSYPMAD